jgi:hypothetical protein
MTTSCEPPTPISTGLTEECELPVLSGAVGYEQAVRINAARHAECRVQMRSLIEAVEERQAR